MTPLNNSVLIQMDKPIEKIGSIFIPTSAQRKLNSGTVISFSPKLEGKLEAGQKVFYMEYPQKVRGKQFAVILEEENQIMTPYESLNAIEFTKRYPNEILRKINDQELSSLVYHPPIINFKATGSKILVKIDKKKQESNKFITSLKLFRPEFNNQFAFNNQYGEVISVGPDVKENVIAGDIAIFNHMIESDETTLIQKLDDGDEIRVVETGTEFNYEWIGYIHDEEFISNNHYVFVEETAKENILEVTPNKAGLLLTEEMKTTSPLKQFIVSHSNQHFKKGDIVMAQGKSVEIENLKIRYIHAELIECKLILDGDKHIIIPLEDRIVLKRDDAKSKTDGGLYIPENSKVKPRSGVLVAIGPGTEKIPMVVNVGDNVVFGKTTGSSITVDEEDYIVMPQDGIMYIKEAVL